MMNSRDKDIRGYLGDPPSDDPVERAGHVVKAFMDHSFNEFAKNESEMFVTATSNVYDGTPWTGMTWGDLRKLWALAEQAQHALDALRQMEIALDALKAPTRVGDGPRLTPVGRLAKMLSQPYRPRREDAVARWLKRMRDHFGAQDRLDEVTPEAGELKWRWGTIDGLLDRYRECADFGLSLEPDDDDAETYP